MCDCVSRARILNDSLTLLTSLSSAETDETVLLALRLVTALLEGELVVSVLLY